jgi:hypothetical protein
MNRLYEYFTSGTQGTKSGGAVGIEIETHFANANGLPISTRQTDALLKMPVSGGCLKLELGRQIIELNVPPEPSFERLWEKTSGCLEQLYEAADELGCYPVFAPTPYIGWPDPLLYVQEERDAVWVELDGASALEYLSRCSSVQFTVNVNPVDAIIWINKLWGARFHEGDYAGNDRLWQSYIVQSRFGYRPDRYGGPDGFADLCDYVARLAEHEVVMYHGAPCRRLIENVSDPDINLFLRSIWWHYRLRRYGDALAIEIRPFPRKVDENIPKQWKLVAGVLGI